MSTVLATVETAGPCPSGSEWVPLTSIPLREPVELCRIDLPDHQAEPLLERGLLPGCQLHRVRNSPAGDPIVRVEGSLLALRRETAAQLLVQATPQTR